MPVNKNDPIISSTTATRLLIALISFSCATRFILFPPVTCLEIRIVKVITYAYAKITNYCLSRINCNLIHEFNYDYPLKLC